MQDKLDTYPLLSRDAMCTNRCSRAVHEHQRRDTVVANIEHVVMSIRDVVDLSHVLRAQSGHSMA